jgi:GT2 family glycosyltransferase
LVDTKAVSIIIPTYNRRDRLERVLAAFDRQGEPTLFEAIVVDDGSSDGTAEWLASRSYRFELRAIRQENGGPAKARNTGVHAARGTLLLFVDDDVEPSEDLVGEHLRSHAKEKDVVVMGPLASLPHYRQPWVAWEQARLEAQYAAMLRGDWAPTFRQFWTGNASVAREHVLAVGGFDTSYLRGEDVELGYRLHQRGLEFRFNPTARGLHHVERSLEGWVKAHLSYGKIEPELFSRLGDDQDLEVLGANWSRLHPATRWLVERCIDRPSRHAAAASMLQRVLKLQEATQTPIGAQEVCGALANLLYWRGCADAVGTQRARQIMRRGDEMRRASAKS